MACGIKVLLIAPGLRGTTFFGRGRAGDFILFPFYKADFLLVLSYDPGLTYIQRIQHGIKQHLTGRKVRRRKAVNHYASVALGRLIGAAPHISTQNLDFS